MEHGSEDGSREAAGKSHAMKIFPTCLFCLPFYFMTVLCLCIEILPPDAMAIFGGRPGGDGDTLKVSLIMGIASLALGVILHVIFYRLNPERFSVRDFRFAGIGMIVFMAGLFLLSVILSRATGLPPVTLKGWFDWVMGWMGAIALGVAAILLAAAVVGVAAIVIMLKCYPANRMARRLEVGDAAGAIRIGEACPEHKRDFLTNANLVAAYASVGRKEDAQRLLAILEQIDKVPKYYTQETFTQTLDGLRELVAEGPRLATSPPVGPDIDNP